MYKKILHSTERYLTKHIVEQCFEPGKVLTVDKQVCGNGFSTAFLNLDITPGKVNIIIAPNKAVLIEKQQAYKNNPEKFTNRLKFFYKESLDHNFENADVLFFVADSFLNYKNSLSNIANKIEKVLIDEAHSTVQQSTFRPNLIDFESKVKAIINYPRSAITKVTASPTLFNKSDIFIDNEYIKEQTIYTSKDRSEALKRIKADIKNNENIVVFTNSSTLIYSLRNYKNEVKANFIIGTSLMQNITELATIVIDSGSNLTIVSSRGFEGFDIHQENAKVYYFEDRSNDFESFYISNLYQAISRTRKGAKYVEYCRQELSNRRKEPFKNIDADIDAFILDASLSVENKQKTEYKKYHSFVIFEQDEKGIYSIKKNNVAIDLYKETLIYDQPFPADEFTSFIKERKLIFKDISEVNNRLTKKVKTSQKVKNLFNNRKLIENLRLFDNEYTIKIYDFHSHKITDTNEYRKLYLKHLETFLRRKNYNGCYNYSERENIALNILKDKKSFNSLVADVTKTYDVRSIEKYGVNDSESYRKEFKIKGSCVVGMLITMFTNDRINVPKKWVANRDYNLLTAIGIDELILIGSVFNVDVLEIDIKNCFPRIIYALNNKTLPSGFYGENKANKYKINKFLNNFFYRSSLNSPKKMQRNNAIIKFQEFGFDTDVINYLIDNYFECEFRGELFARLSFQEKKIISDIKRVCNLENEGIIRRHDSIIVFNNKADLSFINEYDYLGVRGWFDVKTIQVIDINRFNTDNDAKIVNF